MKKLFVLTLVLVMGLTLTACQKDIKEDVYEIEVTEDVTETKDFEMNDIEKEFYNTLVYLNENVEVGTAGSSLKAVEPTTHLINWSLGSEIYDEQIVNVLNHFVSELEFKDEFIDQMSLVKSTATALISDDCDMLLEESGNSNMDKTWEAAGMKELNPRLVLIFTTLGI